jgi:RNA recognition motif-containing protein
MNRLYVGNLPFSATAEEVQAAFQAHGTVTDVRVVTDRATGRSRGFAFVTMGSSEEAARAMEKMEGVMLGGRPMRVSEAQERAPRRDGPPREMPMDMVGFNKGGFGDQPRRRNGPGRGDRGRKGAPRRGERW